MNSSNTTFRNYSLLLGFLLFSATLFSQDCKIQITAPEQGSPIDGEGLVSGKVLLPPNGHVWLLSHKVGFSGWWPQGNGAAQVIGEDWDVLVYYGNKGDYGKFEVIAMVVDNQTHQDLKNWVKNAPKTNPPYQPIASLPASMEGCPLARLRVEKKQE